MTQESQDPGWLESCHSSAGSGIGAGLIHAKDVSGAHHAEIGIQSDVWPRQELLVVQDTLKVNLAQIRNGGMRGMALPDAKVINPSLSN